MTISLKADAGGTFGTIQIGGVDKVTVDNSGNMTLTGKITQSNYSMVRVNTANGWGSGNYIRRFANFTNGVNGAVVQGSDITVADSTAGTTFTVNSNGVYAITYTERYAAASVFGLSLNTASPAIAVTQIPTSERLVCADTAGANYENSTSWTGYLAAGSVIRAHDTSGLSEGTVLAVVNLTIVRIA